MTFLLVLVLILSLTLLSLAWWTGNTARRIEVAIPPIGRFVDVPGARLHVFEKGQGPTLLLIHGLGGSLRHFSYGLVDALAEHHHIIAVDRPGSGYSLRDVGSSASLNTQADAMAALIDALGLQRPTVVGHSLGGAVALALAQRHAQKVGRLALIAPLTHKPRGISAAFAGLMIPPVWLRRVVAWTVALPGSMLMRERVLGRAFGPEPVPPRYGTLGGGLLTARPSHFIASSADLFAAPVDMAEIISGYASMQLPVQVLYGRGDRVLDPQEQGQALIDKLPGAQLVLVDGGHMLPLTQIERTAAFIRTAAA